ncbi:ROK family protein [Leifsonia sp. NPDC058194]|uniref:ROK family protein n=1 Tax=Leifsonia sp. NPDC058194 TaxID=3346374 RepID=UPI0036DE1383
MLQSEANATQIRDASRVVRMIRDSGGATRPALTNELDMGRDALNQRLAQLTAAGLIVEGDTVASTGGRAPREFTFNTKGGLVLAASAGVTNFSAAITDLDGEIYASATRAVDASLGPHAALDAIIETLRDLLIDPAVPDAPAWGLGMSIPGPVDSSRGIPLHPVVSPGWNKFPVRQYLEDALGIPVWVENDVALLTLGELRKGAGAGHQNFLFVKMGAAIGAGLVSGGRLYRGGDGAAGMLGHVKVSDDPRIVCVCGHIGCLGSVAGGLGIAHHAAELAAAGQSEHLAQALAENGSITFFDVLEGVERGDSTSWRLLADAGTTLGGAVAAVVNVFNPSLIILGGSIPVRSELVVSRVKEAVYNQSLPITTHSLVIQTSDLEARAGIVGAASLVVDEVLQPTLLRRWFTTEGPAYPALERVRDVAARV